MEYSLDYLAVKGNYAQALLQELKPQALYISVLTFSWCGNSASESENEFES